MINALISFYNKHIPEVLAKKSLGEAQELIQTTWGSPPEDPTQLVPAFDV